MADPNKPWAEAPFPNPSAIEIFANNTFHFVSNGEVRYQSSTIANGMLPGTVMYDTPFHVVSSQPHTPFWELIWGLTTLLGGLFILSGEAEVEELKGDGANFYATSDAGREIVPTAIPGLARLPILDYEGSVPELYAQQGRLPEKLELSVRTLAHAASTSSASPGFRFGVRTAQHAVSLESPIAPAGRDRIELTQTRTPRPLLAVTTAEAPKVSKVKYSVLLDKQKRGGWSVETNLGVAREATARLGAALDGLSLLVENAGPAQPSDVRLVTFEQGRPTSSRLSLPEQARQGVIRLRPEDLVSPHGNMIIERLSSLNGSVLEKLVDRMRPDLP